MRSGNMKTSLGRSCLSGVMALSMAFGMASADKAEAVSVDIFLIANQSAPSASTGAPFSTTTSTVYQLGGIRSDGKATTATLVDNFTFGIDQAMTFNSLWDDDAAKPTDPSETMTGGMASYINSEIATLDTAGISGSTADPAKRLDMGRNSQVTLNSVSGGFTDLLIAEIGGLNPFIVDLCPDALCNTVSTVFSGFNSRLRRTLLGFDEFASSDTGVEGEMDQLWLFRFKDRVNDFVRVTEQDSRSIYTGARLQADFIGVGGTATSAPAVPLPTSLPLLAGGLGLMGWTLRRRKTTTA